MKTTLCAALLFLFGLGFAVQSSQDRTFNLDVRQDTEQEAKRRNLPTAQMKSDNVDEIINAGAEGVLEWKRRYRYNTEKQGTARANESKVLNERSISVCDLPFSHTANDPLPVESSDTIVVGEIQTADASLSSDRTNIFSQFNIRVTQVIKSGKVLPVNKDDVIIGERQGGKLVFPSGRIVTRYRCTEKMPVTGNTYLFFLASQSDTKDFHIVTGYDIAGDVVHPLDEDLQGASLTPFAQLDGTKLTELLRSVAGKAGRQ